MNDWPEPWWKPIRVLALLLALLSLGLYLTS